MEAILRQAGTRRGDCWDRELGLEFGGAFCARTGVRVWRRFLYQEGGKRSETVPVPGKGVSVWRRFLCQEGGKRLEESSVPGRGQAFGGDFCARSGVRVWRRFLCHDGGKRLEESSVPGMGGKRL